MESLHFLTALTGGTFIKAFALAGKTGGCGIMQQHIPQFFIQLTGDFRAFFQKEAGVGFALADFLAVIAVPSAGFFDQFVLDAQVYNSP